MNNTFYVELGARRYPIYCGAGLHATAGDILAPFIKTKAMIITDDHVAPLYLAALEESLARTVTLLPPVIIAAGEASKDFSTVDYLCQTILSHGVDRHTTLIALGGGVVGDITGFVASIMLRGIPYIQIPTTLLAMVDSSVGGKTGINTAQGKNLVGSFYQPHAVLIDPVLLRSLPPRHFLAGYAEILKYACIGDAAFFAWLQEHGAAVLAGQPDALSHAITTAYRHKAAIVAQDETDHGARMLLNFGHTFGHAYEAQAGYSDRLLHGEAVALGMIKATALSVHLKLCAPRVLDDLIAHYQQIGLPQNPDEFGAFDKQALLAQMDKDKKASAGQRNFILLHDMGRAFVQHGVDEADILAVL